MSEYVCVRALCRRVSARASDSLTDESTKPADTSSSSMPVRRTRRFSPGRANDTSSLSLKMVTTLTTTCQRREWEGRTVVEVCG